MAGRAGVEPATCFGSCISLTFFTKPLHVMLQLLDATSLRTRVNQPIKMAGLTGLEPATSCVTGKHSEPDELQPHKNGSGGEFRKPDISINSRTLCL